MTYPILTTDTSKFIPNPAFTIVPIVNNSILIDNFPVVIQFNWTNNNSGSTGTVMGQSIGTLVDGNSVVLVDSTVSPYYTYTGVPTTESD